MEGQQEQHPDKGRPSIIKTDFTYQQLGETTLKVMMKPEYRQKCNRL